MNKKWIFLIIIFLMLSVIGTLGYAYISSDNKSTVDVIFTRAEELYNQKKYISALKYYQLFLSQDEADEVAKGLAQQRLAAIEENLQNQKRIEGLLEKALTAFEDKNFLTPEEDNATGYTLQILQIDPDNTTALLLKESMIQHYTEQAKRDERRGRLSRAIEKYESALQIMPENKEIHDKRAELMQTAGIR
ncbi:MAG: hypothetical protein ACRBF0_01005 [Calditrichia bacterium]